MAVFAYIENERSYRQHKQTIFIISCLRIDDKKDKQCLFLSFENLQNFVKKYKMVRTFMQLLHVCASFDEILLKFHLFLMIV